MYREPKPSRGELAKLLHTGSVPAATTSDGSSQVEQSSGAGTSRDKGKRLEPEGGVSGDERNVEGALARTGGGAISGEMRDAILESKLQYVGSLPPHLRGEELDRIVRELFSDDEADDPLELSPAILRAAPHLRELGSRADLDGHLRETLRLKAVYTRPAKTIEKVVDLMRSRATGPPLPRSIWRTIVQDKYVDFEKLLAALNGGYGYDSDDDEVDIGSGFFLVKKERYYARKRLVTEGDWAYVFDAWRDGVVALYPHRDGELKAYRSIVVDGIRRPHRGPAAAFQADRELRQLYERQLFRLDDRR